MSFEDCFPEDTENLGTTEGAEHAEKGENQKIFTQRTRRIRRERREIYRFQLGALLM
jgi:hypothetical protein